MFLTKIAKKWLPVDNFLKPCFNVAKAILCDFYIYKKRTRIQTPRLSPLLF